MKISLSLYTINKRITKRDHYETTHLNLHHIELHINYYSSKQAKPNQGQPSGLLPTRGEICHHRTHCKSEDIPDEGCQGTYRVERQSLPNPYFTIFQEATPNYQLFQSNKARHLHTRSWQVLSTYHHPRASFPRCPHCRHQSLLLTTLWHGYREAVRWRVCKRGRSHGHRGEGSSICRFQGQTIWLHYILSKGMV